MTGSVSSSNGTSTTSGQCKPKLGRKEGRRQRLLQDPNFRLIKVVHGKTRTLYYGKEIESLTVVTPASDPTIAKDVKRNGWCCLSHLWGDPSEWIDWDDAGVVDGNTGGLVKAKVHPNKRDGIMSFLKEFDGYWWIDIFCAQSDTPLGIMGDIYRFCQMCFCVIDYSFGIFGNGYFKVFDNAVMLCGRNRTEATNAYLDVITKTQHKDDVSAEWKQILKDLLHWPSTQFVEKANQELLRWKARYSKGPRMEEFFDLLLQHPVDERIETAQKFLNSEQYKPGDIGTSQKKFIEYLQEYDPESHIRAQQGVAEFLNCRWMNRVWTLQELALPGTASFPGDLPMALPFSIWLKNFINLFKVIAKAYEIRETTSMVGQSERKRGTVIQTPRQVLDYYQKTDPVLARIYSDYRKMFEVVTAIGHISALEWKSSYNLGQKIMLNSFATSQRKALYPEDYVYGVLGVLNIDILRLKDCDEIWRIFSKELREQYPDIHVPSDVNLAEATKMEDVYGGFGFPTGWDVSTQVVDYLCLMSL